MESEDEESEGGGASDDEVKEGNDADMVPHQNIRHRTRSNAATYQHIPGSRVTHLETANVVTSTPIESTPSNSKPPYYYNFENKDPKQECKIREQFNRSIEPSANSPPTTRLTRFMESFQHESAASATASPQGMQEIACDVEEQQETADSTIRASDCFPEPLYIKQIMRLPEPLKTKWIDATRKEVKVIVENNTFNTDDMPLPW